MRVNSGPGVQTNRTSRITRPSVGRPKLGRQLIVSRVHSNAKDEIAGIVEFAQAKARAKPATKQKLVNVSFFPEEPLLHGVMTIIALLLLSQFWWQIKIFPNMQLAKQPGFWPGVSLAGMILFGFGSLWRSLQRANVRGTSARTKELHFWARSLEYPIWFFAYVWLVPVIGYLLGTVIIACALVWRTGYRSLKEQVYAALTGVAIVVIFKSFLEVKIPGGAIYEYLPNALRTFAIVNF